jgi:inorganic pyrophosphatase
LNVRLVGVVEIVQTEKGKQSKNDRVLAVAVRSFDYADVRSISDLQHSLVEQIKEFLALYNKNSGKQDEVKGVAGPERAMALLNSAIREFTRKQPPG